MIRVLSNLRSVSGFKATGHSCILFSCLAMQNWENSSSRRHAFRALAGMLAASPLLRAQLDPFREHHRIPKLDELITALDFEPVFHAKLPRQVYNYTAYGVDGEFTLRRNRQAFDWVDLVPGAGIIAGTPATATELFGTKMAYPLLVSPTAAHVAIHPEGEAATRQGATAASNTPMIVSNVASLPIEKIGAAATGPFWFQLYAKEDPALNRETLERAQTAGCRAVVVTIDQQASVYDRAIHDANLSPVSPRRGAPRATGDDAARPAPAPEAREVARAAARDAPVVPAAADGLHGRRHFEPDRHRRHVLRQGLSRTVGCLPGRSRLLGGHSVGAQDAGRPPG